MVQILCKNSWWNVKLKRLGTLLLCLLLNLIYLRLCVCKSWVCFRSCQQIFNCDKWFQIRRLEGFAHRFTPNLSWKIDNDSKYLKIIEPEARLVAFKGFTFYVGSMYLVIIVPNFQSNMLLHTASFFT